MDKQDVSRREAKTPKPQSPRISEDFEENLLIKNSSASRRAAEIAKKDRMEIKL
jgi:hypothetical protein